MRITLSKNIVEKYAPYVRISTTKENPNHGNVRVSNSGKRWGISGSDFRQLFAASIFMMAYSLETVESIREDYNLKRDVTFLFDDFSPVDVISLVESTVNRDVPKGGRPKPTFANLEGSLIEPKTKGTLVGTSETSDSSSTSGMLVGAEPYPAKRKREKISVSTKRDHAKSVREEVEVSDDLSARFRNTDETSVQGDLEDVTNSIEKVETVETVETEVVEPKSTKKKATKKKETKKESKKSSKKEEPKKKVSKKKATKKKEESEVKEEPSDSTKKVVKETTVTVEGIVSTEKQEEVTVEVASEQTSSDSTNLVQEFEKVNAEYQKQLTVVEDQQKEIESLKAQLKEAKDALIVFNGEGVEESKEELKEDSKAEVKEEPKGLFGRLKAGIKSLFGKK